MYDMFNPTNVGKEREMPIGEDDDDDVDFKIVASIYEFSKKRTLAHESKEAQNERDL